MFYKLNLLKRNLINKFPSLGRFLNINYGLLPEIEDERDNIMGANERFNWQVIKPDSKWTEEFKKIDMEVQKGRYFDTMGCTGYSLMNCIEMLAMAKWGEKWNLSDRYINKMSNTSRRGNSMRNVLESVRKFGVVNEEDWPWDREKFSWNEYYKTVPSYVIAKGMNWLKEYNFGYESVWSTKAMIIEALKYSPLYVGGYAWYKRGMFYYSTSNPNHCFTSIEELLQRSAGDSYNPFIKHLAPNYKLYYVKRVYLEKKNIKFNIQLINKNLEEGVRYVTRSEANGEFYKLTKEGLVYIKNLEMIADDIANEMKISPKHVNEMLTYLTEKKKLKWLSEEGYYKYLK